MNEHGEKDSLKAILYDSAPVENLDIEELSSYLRKKNIFNEVLVRESPVEKSKESIEDLPEMFARAKVRDPQSPKEKFDPMYGEIKFEERLLRNPERDVSGVLYDGLYLDEIYRGLLPKEEMKDSFMHIIFTNRLFGTWSENDGRYHARVSVYGFPSIISTSGIVEAPAKPKEFYREKRRRNISGQTSGVMEELKKEFEGEFVDYNDERLTEVIKGYLMQAVFYHISHEPFCENENCRLYNAHWQEEVLESQLSSPEFCKEHKEAIRKWRKNS